MQLRSVVVMAKLELWIEGSPESFESEEALDWPAIRTEFARKAKKLGLTANNDVSFRPEKKGCVLWCIATGRA